MKICVLVLLAVVTGATAHCGCLKCSKHLTVVGQSIPVPNCGPATIVYRDLSLPDAKPSLSVSLQAPIPSPPAGGGGVILEGLSYSVGGPSCAPLITGPIIRVIEEPTVVKTYEQPPGLQYDSKIEAPLPSVTTTTLTIPSEKLTACVDRVVVPAPAVDAVFSTGENVISEVVSPFLEKFIHTVPTTPLKSPPITYIGPSSGGCGSWSYTTANGGRPMALSGPALDTQGFNSPGIFVNPLAPVSTGGCSGGAQPPPCSRYERIAKLAFVQVILSQKAGKSVPNGNKNLVTKNTSQKKRSKRDLPFIQHGYKFMMNMLPEFIQQPIKSTVNSLAFTHPDRRLQYLYSQPPELSLKEKLQLQSKKNLAAIKERLNSRRATNLINKPYKDNLLGTKSIKQLVTGVEKPIKTMYPWPQYVHSRFSDVNKPDDSGGQDDVEKSIDKLLESVKKNMEASSSNQQSRSYNFPKYTLPPQSRLTKLNRRFDLSQPGGLVSRKLSDANEESPSYDWLRQERFFTSSEFQEDDNTFKSKPVKIIRPFSSRPERTSRMTKLQKDLFSKKLKELNELRKRSKRSTYFQRKKYLSDQYDPRSSVVLDSEQLVLPFYQVKQKDSYEDDSVERGQRFLNNKVDPGTKDEILRAIIRKELKNFKTKREDEANTLDPFHYGEMVPHSPLFHLLRLPVMLISKLSEFGAPLIGSFPKVVTGTRKYFKDFGRNFGNNLLDFFSNIVGDFENLGPSSNTLNIMNPTRHRRNTDKSKIKRIITDGTKIQNRYALENFDGDFKARGLNNSEVRIRKKRYLLKMVEEAEVEEFLMEKLGGLFDQPDTNLKKDNRWKPNVHTLENCPYCQFSTDDAGSVSVDGDEVTIEQLKPKLIIDNNGRPFLEINGYKKPILGPKRNRASKKSLYDSEEMFIPYDDSDETNSEKIDYIIDHARNRLDDGFTQRYVDMPIKTIKEKISHLLFDTDILVHMDFEKYDDIYDDLFKIQYIKTSVVQDWKRLLMGRRVNDINGKISILSKLQEMQGIKDNVQQKIIHCLNEENENKFAIRMLTKMLIRLQKLQCTINEVVDNFQEKFQMQYTFDTAKEIKYVEFLSSLNFVNDKTRNGMIENLKKARDVALEENMCLLDSLKKLLNYEDDPNKVSEVASFLWETGNIHKMQQHTIEELHQRFASGYKIKKELKILFDLLKRQEACEREQKRLLSKFEDTSTEHESCEDELVSEEKVVTKKKFDIKEFREKWQEKVRKRQLLLKRNLRKRMRNRNMDGDSFESTEDE